jgi:ketose-bisphosphate aldolase
VVLMALKSVSTILKDAQKNHYAVAAFNVFNFESISWIIKAAEQENAPVIAMLYPSVSSHIPASTFCVTVKDIARNAKVPVGVHYDHSNSFEQIMTAIKEGFPSVMIDGSYLPFDENVKITRDIVRVAHPMGIDVEAELGYVGRASNENDYVNSSTYTNPDSAVEFVDRTGVDSLAIAIGSAHGNYVSAPNLDLDRLKEIRNKISVPLVLHGGSGIPDDQIKKAVKLGITKLNIGTEFGQQFYLQMKEIMMGEKAPKSMLGCLSALESGMVSYIRSKIQLLKG